LGGGFLIRRPFLSVWVVTILFLFSHFFQN